jgi:hypothetical protein
VAERWSAEILERAPLIAPARVYIWPRAIVGEEDALARGALYVQVKAGSGGFLLQCALGFTDRAMPRGVWRCPAEDEICVVAGGYAYVGKVGEPERCILLDLKPVVDVIETAGLLVFVGFQRMVAWGRDGLSWETGRLSWEGIRVISASDVELRGLGWDLMADVEREFVVDLRDGSHSGGGYAS